MLQSINIIEQKSRNLFRPSLNAMNLLFLFLAIASCHGTGIVNDDSDDP